MRSGVLLLIIGLASIGCSNSQVSEAQNGLQPAELSAEAIKLLHNHLKTFPDETQVSMALIDQDTIRYYGVRRINGMLQAEENSTKVFEIGSISKVFTATILANYVVSGKVKLDETLDQHVDIPFHQDAKITFSSLANHTSGLPRMPSNFMMGALFNPSNPYKSYDEEKLNEYLIKELKYEYPPGTKSSYSNLGAGLLGHVLCKISGKEYQQLVDELIFKQYKMNSSTTQREDISDLLIAGRNESGSETANWDLGALIGAGGIYSSVKDLVLFAQAQFDSTNVELALTRKSTFKSNSTSEVGLGWHMRKQQSGDVWHWHNGATGGYRSCMALNVNKRQGVIILSNISAFHKQADEIDQLCFSLMKNLK
ncbi:MAG: serine hydrolase [Cyclobacteriaceae bacterium]|nr:MAG: serine hydrolase [Cyclobacteriaceae bacterium]